MKPVVSVLVTSYNREKYIAECLESILQSSFTDFELIIVDDASTDRTVEICKDFEAKDKRIKLYVNETNLGQFRNRNKAASLASGEYIKYFDSDDIMKPSGLETMVDAMLKYKDAGAGSQCDLIKYSNELPKKFTSHHSYISHFFEGNNMLYIGPSGTIVKKEIFDKVGGFNETIGILADTYLMLKIAAIAPIIGFAPNQFIWRRHDEQVTIGQQHAFSMLVERRKINKRILEDKNCPLKNKEKKVVERNLKNIFIRNLPKHFWNLKSFTKTKILFKEYDLHYSDVLKAIRPNKQLEILIDK